MIAIVGDAVTEKVIGDKLSNNQHTSATLGLVSSVQWKTGRRPTKRR